MLSFLRCLLLASFLLLHAVPAIASDLCIMAEEYPPYSYHVDGEAKGLVVELVKIIQERLGEHPSKIIFYPWARGYKKLQAGMGDVLFPMAMTPERSALFKFVGPVFWDDVYFYGRKGCRIELKTVDDAKKVGMIAVTRDDVFHLNLVNMGFANLDVSSSQVFDFMKLNKGRVALVPMGRKALQYLGRQHPELHVEELERLGPPVFFTTAYIAFAHKTPDEVIRKWQTVLDQLKSEGVWQEIMDRYFPPEPEK
ncbi:substrate-binding periplasmic protein [Maridesulfovibrio sp. FT414]|uniref:substrate-binding periplasmic protein n=1 Tax=Maridesulfovibrio sp. FT414 TaxID=2979469 RepID=UPI003D8030A1